MRLFGNLKQTCKNLVFEGDLVEGDEGGALDEDVGGGDDRHDHVDVHQEPVHHQRHVAPVVDHLSNSGGRATVAIWWVAGCARA